MVPPREASVWLARLVDLKTVTGEVAAAIVRIGALTGDAARDLPTDVREAAAARLRRDGPPDGDVAPLLEIRHDDGADVARAFGEPLPEGLRLETGAHAG